jgi:repressor LexA
MEGRYVTMKGLTEKQRNILNFIEDFMEINVMAPTVYEIAEHFNVKTSTVFAHLRSLQKKNFLSRSSKARSISLNKPRSKTRKPNGVCSIPVYENNGERSRKDFYYDYSSMKDAMDSRKLFAVRVSDNTMTGAGILDGDIAILKKFSDTVRNGDIVLVEVEGRNLLRTFRELPGERMELTSPSGNSMQFTKQESPIKGVLVGVQRSL